MKEEHIHASHLLQYGFFAFLIIAVASVVFLIFKPFLSIVFLSVILAVVFHPLYMRILKSFGGHETLSAFATILVVMALVVAPLVFFGYLLFLEASNLYAYFAVGGGMQKTVSTLAALEAALSNRLPGLASTLQASQIVETYAQAALNWVVTNISWFFASFFKTFLFIMLTLIGFFHFLKGGENVARILVGLSPLEDAHDRKIHQKILSAINAVVRGRLAMGAIQGVFAGVGFALFGVPNPVFLGFLTAFCSLVPAIGTALVLVPSAAFLFITGNVAAGIGMTVWGAVAVGLVDDLIAPYFIQRGMQLHPLIILISVLGGIELFGLVGLVAGPVIVALFFALLDIYVAISKHSGTTI